MDWAIRTEEFTKYYGNVRGIVDLEMDVPQGMVYGYLGTDTAGKTTTVRMLVDLIRPTGGSATVLGMDSQRDAVKIRKRVGYLPAQPAFYWDLTARQHLRWLGRLRGGIADDVVKDMGDRLALPLDRRVAELSALGRRKLGLAQAFMHKPDLLILDEPTLGLDEQTARAFYALVREARADGRTVFFTSSMFGEVDLLCDWVGFVRDGRLLDVKEVAEMREQALRRVTVRFQNTVPAHELRELAGVQEVDVSGDLATFHVVGNIDPVVKTVSGHEILDLTVGPADLAEVFERFYAEGVEA